MSINDLLFTSPDGSTLYSYDGSTVIQLANASSTPSYQADPLHTGPISAVTVGQMAYFTLADSTNTTSAIWSYDGTTATQITSSSNYINAQADANNKTTTPAAIGSYNGDLVFSQGSLATDTDSGRYDHATLAIYDPTTQQITQPVTPNDGYDPKDFVTLGSTLYFEATDSTTNAEAIYSYDGSTVT